MAYLARSAAASLRQPQRSSLLLQHLGAIRLASSTPESTASAAADKAKSAADSAKEGAKSAAESAKQTASSAADSAKQTANSAADTAKDYASKASEQGSKMLNQVSERASGLLGAYKEPIVYNFAVAREVAKQVYIAEKLAPPTNLDTIRSAYEEFYSKGSSASWWRSIFESGEWKRVALYAIEAYGIFKLGEMIGRRHIVGYKVDAPEH